jgi:hypothetical protein
MLDRSLALFFALGLAAACKPSTGLTPCADSSVCTLVAGGMCLPSPEGIDLCAYPTTECPSGFSWSPQAGDLAGVCVGDDADAATNNGDGGTDARPDAGPPAQWARAFGGSDSDLILDLVSTPDDGIILVGHFRNSITFGGPTLDATPGHSDAFVAKLSASGQHVWSKRLGGVGYDGAHAVAVDAAGDVYVAGICQGSADFDGQTLAVCGEFLLKLSGATGSRVWVQRIGPTGLTAQDLAVTSDGSAIYFAAQFFGTINLGGQSLTSAADSYDVALAKYDDTGAHTWSVRAGGSGAEEPGGIDLMPNGDVLVVGRYQGQADFGTGTPLQEIGAVGQDAFIARFGATNGAGVWARGFGSTSSLPTMFLSVVADNTGAYVGGSFYGTASFGGSMQVASGTDSDGILAKYETTNGTHLWSTKIGGSKTDVVQQVRVSGTELWLAGAFTDSTMVGSHPLLSAGGSDVMYAKADASTGDINGAANLGGTGGEGDAHLVLSTNHLTIAGPYGTAFTLLGIPLPSPMGTDIFVGRIIR